MFFLLLALALALAVAGAGAYELRKVRALHAEVGRLEQRIESLSDERWELREAEERAKSLLEAQGDLIVRRAHDGCLTYVNDAFCALAQQSHGALIGRPFAWTVLDSGETTTLADGTRCYDQQIETPDGPRWISWHEVTVRSGSHAEIQYVGRDVTARRLVERTLADARDQADAANRAKGRFLAMVSHEIRTPLNGILGMADLLNDTALTPEQASYVQALRASGETLLSLIEEILDLSKIDAGKLVLDPGPLALESLIETTVELLAPRAQAKQIEIASFVDPRLPRTVTGDAARLRQVLLNLAGNAVKFTERGGVTVTAELGDGKDEILFSVRDSGIGIAPEAQSRIFEEFEQAESGAARKFGGTGLGLAISRRIVERMGGRLTLLSTPGEGSMFTFAVLLPATASDDRFVAPNLGDTRILLAAPQHIEADLVARRLSAWGAAVSVTVGVERTCAALVADEWHTVIVDTAFGLTAIGTIAAACSASVRRRLVLVTPRERGHLQACKDAGFSGYLVKPVRAASLAARFGVDHANLWHPASTTQVAAESAASLAILVAEDNEINALLARALLQRLGHRPTVVGNGEQAVAQFEAAHDAGTPFDLVLMDVHMPGMDGMDAARRMRAGEARRAIAHTRIIALTADVGAADRDACLAAGMDACLTKPLDRERLVETIAALRGAAIAA